MLVAREILSKSETLEGNLLNPLLDVYFVSLERMRERVEEWKACLFSRSSPLRFNPPGPVDAESYWIIFQRYNSWTSLSSFFFIRLVTIVSFFASSFICLWLPVSLHSFYWFCIIIRISCLKSSLSLSLYFSLSIFIFVQKLLLSEA